MTSRAEFLELGHKLVPFSETVDTSFQYEEITYTLGQVRYNKAANALSTSLTWKVGEVTRVADGIIIQNGVNIIQQYNTILPSLVAINKNSTGNITDISELELYIIVDYDEYFRGL